ncbi:LacI family DNA-binding transcriptional regulator [Cohnella boryungensis]|uniref:LacI family DNA-binding transcriptional regulator n=1 Tax=Cohnella boryungensis TaxID=768479 RepID=A0ABV8S3M4_9BACL
MAKIEDVAERAGVSVTTVSRVLNNRGYISQRTRDRVEQAMKELRYQPNEMARSLFRRKSNTIGLIIPSVAHPFFGELAYHLEEYADRRGYKLLLCNSNRDVVKERKYIDMLKKNQVDAIVMGSSVVDIEHYLHLDSPIVSFDRTLADNIPIVTSDNRMGGTLAARLLIEKGCRRPAYVFRGIGGPHHQALMASERVLGFDEALREAGIGSLHLELEAVEGDSLRSEEDLVRFLLEHPEVDGVFASSDVIAAEVIQASHRLQKRIPHELKLVGYDDIHIASFFTPRLSTIRQPIREMCECTVDLIARQLEGEEVAGVHSFPVELIERETT